MARIRCVACYFATGLRPGGVPRNKFYRYSKTHVLEAPLDERDLLFVHDGGLAKWVVE